MSGGDDQRWYEIEKTRGDWFTDGDAADERPERKAPDTTVREEARDVPVHAEADVLVVGGGPAGCASATAAARMGADVLLVERYGHLGGLATGGLVFWIDRMTDWDGNLVITGYAADVLGRMPEDAVFGPAPELWGSQDPGQVAYWKQRQKAFRDTVTWSPTVDPEWLQLASLDLLQEAGARLLLHSWMSTALVEDGNVRGSSSRASRVGGRSSRRSSSTRAATSTSLARRAPRSSRTSTAATSTTASTSSWRGPASTWSAGSRSCWSGRTNIES